MTDRTTTPRFTEILRRAIEPTWSQAGAINAFSA